MSLVDLHTHTTESDGTLSPEQLVEAALQTGLGTLAITDHDTLTAYEPAVAAARGTGLEVIRGIELTSRHLGSSVHLLAYFFDAAPVTGFEAWLEHLLVGRRDRNRRLAMRLRELGLDVEVAEAEQYGGRLTGRPHFARVLMSKGYVQTSREAFDRYLGESAEAYVEREAPGVVEAVERIQAAGGVSSLAHPGRVRAMNPESAEATLREFATGGLSAMEAFHSDHSAAETGRFLNLAEKFGLAVSGGSDFHGTNKPGVELGRGVNGNLRVPDWVVPALRARSGR